MTYVKIDSSGKTGLQILAVCLVSLLLLVPAACKKGGSKGDIEKIYLDYHKALQAEDIKALENFLAAEKKNELLGEGAAMKIQLIKGFLPTGIKVIQVKIDGNKAVLEAEGSMPGQEQKMKGEVEFISEGGSWKILKENWSVTLEMDSSKESSSNPFTFSADADDFMKGGKTPEVFQVLKGHQGDISALAFTPDNRFLVSAGYGDYTVRVWNIVSGEEISKVRSENRVRSLAVTPDSSSVLTADAYQNVIAWDIEEGILSRPRTIVANAGDCVAVSPDGKTIVTTEYRQPLQMWSLDTGNLMRKISSEENRRTVVFSPSGKYLAAGSPDNTFTLWETKDWDKETYTISKVSPTSDVASIDITRDDKYLATGHMDSSIVIFDIKKEKELHNFYVTDASTMDVKFSPDGKLLATAHYNKTVYLWDIKTGEEKAQLKRHTGSVSRLAFSPDGTTLASAGSDRQIIIWRCSDAAPFTHIAPAEAGGTAPTPGQKAGKPEMMEVDGNKNLVKNPYANQGLQYWSTEGEVSVKQDEDANSYFSIRYSGDLWQDVPIELADTGRWAVLIALSSSERINPDGDQTGLPYLYGYMMNRDDDHKIDMYLQDDSMKHSLKEAGKWGVVYGIFEIPATTGGIRLFLQQADGRYSQNGSAANFDEPGIYLFDFKEDAEDFVKSYYN